MEHDVVVPAVGESISKGTLSSWLKQTGDHVAEGEDLFELETDKATLAVPAPAAGILRIAVETGTEVEVGQMVGRISADAGAEGPVKAPASPVQSGGSRVSEKPLEKEETRTAPAPGAPVSNESPAEERRGQERVRMSAIRKLTAERLVRSQHQAAHLTTFNEINMSRVSEIRKAHGPLFEQKHGVRLGLMSFFVKACCRALKDYPALNAYVEGDEIVYNHFFNIGVAVATERGLLVPVIRNADRMSFADVERSIRTFAQRAKDKKLSPDDLTGGTFTITNGGVFGSLLSTPIPNPPQAAILGMHTIQNRPVALGDQVAIQPMMYAALTYDHRIIDGREAVGFLVKVKQLLEDPLRFVLEV